MNIAEPRPAFEAPRTVKIPFIRKGTFPSSAALCLERRCGRIPCADSAHPRREAKSLSRSFHHAASSPTRQRAGKHCFSSPGLVQRWTAHRSKKDLCFIALAKQWKPIKLCVQVSGTASGKASISGFKTFGSSKKRLWSISKSCRASSTFLALHQPET